MTRVCGSHYYIAPEVLKKSYNIKCDMWSLGVIIFTCLTGHFPFDNDDVMKIFQDILKKNIKFNFTERLEISERTRVFIKNLMRKDVDKRLSAK